MTRSLVVVGAGGFGRETLDVIEAMNGDGRRTRLEVLGILDDEPNQIALTRLEERGAKWLGPIDQWLQHNTDAGYVIAIGSPSARAAVDSKFLNAGLDPVTLVHPRATIGTSTVVGPGSVVCSGAQVSTNVSIGRHVHINPNATVGHDARLGDYASINPAATISGDVSVGAMALVGAGAVVLQGLELGAGSVVGASACVTRNVPSGATVKGVPAR
jgi:sugar O-acyltransferase (sialic acid O-acetyltransferase NeuD family)